MPPTTQTITQPATHQPEPVSRVGLESSSPRASVFACAWVSDLPSWALQRLEPNLRELPVIVLEGRRVVGQCERARKMGVQPGDAVDRARTLCPEAAIAQLEPSALSAAWESALEAMYQVTPWIEPVRPGLAFLAGITGLDAEALALELHLRVGLAAARGSALLAALAARGHGARLVKDDAVFCSRVPVHYLRGAGISNEVVDRLILFGLKTLGDVLVRVSERQLETQFGLDGKRIWALATGIDTTAVPTFTPASSLSEHWTFDPPALEPHEWTGIVVQLIAQLIARLGALVAGTITVTLVTDLGEVSARQVLKVYTSNQKTLNNAAFRLTLEALTGLEFSRLTLTLSDLLKPTPYQENLFGSLERPNVREAIKLVHQHYPDRIGKLEVSRPDFPLREKRFRFVPLDGEQSRVKRNPDSKHSSKGKKK